MFANIVYILCALSSCACAVLLLLSYQKTRVSLLFWSGLCFVGLALNNIFMLEDLVLSPEMDFSIPRNLSGAIAVCLLLYGLLWKKTLKAEGP